MAYNKLFGEAADSIKSVDFTKSKIETFTENAFADCGDLQKITFGENCKNIEPTVLNDCFNLKHIIFESKTAPKISEQGIDFTNVIIEVPEGTKQAYQAVFDEHNPTATVTTESDILRYTSIDSMLSNAWLFDENDGAAAKWSETEVPGEIIDEELCARFSWSGENDGEPIGGTIDVQIENNEYVGISDITRTEVWPMVGKDDELLVFRDKEESELLFTIQPYSEISENTQYTDNGYTYSFVNVEKPVYGKPTYEGVVVLKDDVTSVGVRAFEEASLTTIKLPQQITEIGKYAFQNCSDLASIVLQRGLISIENNAFENCSRLASIDLPSSLASIGDGAFDSCTSLASIVLPSGLISIGEYTFEGCTSLTSIDLPSGLTSIGDSAFYNCTNLVSIDIPSSLTEIGAAAFYNCTNLVSIDIPSSLTEIGAAAFYNCTSVDSVICRATTPPSLITDNEGHWFSGVATDTCHVPAESISQYESDKEWSSQFKTFVAIQ